MSYLSKNKVSQIKRKILKKHVLELPFPEICLYAQHRVNNLLLSAGAASYNEIKYNFCEVGPGRSRVDPWTLEILLNSSFFQKSPLIQKITGSETPDFFFRSKDAKQGIAEVIKLKAPLLKEINTLMSQEELFISLSKTFQSIARVYDYKLENELIDKDKRFIDLEFHSEEQKILIRFVNTQNWIYPNSSELWSLALKAHESNLQPIILAPFIHGSCFLIFKRIGILGRSLYRSFIMGKCPQLPEDKGLFIGFSTGRFVNPSEDFSETISLLTQTIPSLYKSSKAKFRKDRSYKDLVLASRSCSEKNIQEQLSSLKNISDFLKLPTQHEIRSLSTRYDSFLSSEK